MRCPTTSGRYRCSHDANHGGECETDDSRPTNTFGPFADAHRARAYLRGALDVAAGGALDGIGRRLGIERGKTEPDQVYRARVWTESLPS